MSDENKNATPASEESSAPAREITTPDVPVETVEEPAAPAETETVTAEAAAPAEEAAATPAEEAAAAPAEEAAAAPAEEAASAERVFEMDMSAFDSASTEGSIFGGTTAAQTPPPKKPLLPADDIVIRSFRAMTPTSLPTFNRDCGLHMDENGFAYVQDYYRRVMRRDPFVGELRVMDAVAHMPATGRIGNRLTMGELYTESPLIAETWSDMMSKHTLLSGGAPKPCTWEDALQLTTRYLRRLGRFEPPVPTARNAAPLPARTVTLSRADEYEALADGYSVETRVVLENGIPVSVLLRMGNGPQDMPAKAGDVLLYAPALSGALLESVVTKYRRQGVDTLSALRVVTRKSLLATVADITGGASLFTYNLLPEDQRVGKTGLPLNALCRVPESIGETVGVVICTNPQNAQTVAADLRHRGQTVMALGQVGGNRLVLRVRDYTRGQDTVAADLDAAFLCTMETITARVCRPALLDSVTATVTRPAMARLLCASPAEDGITPAEWETVALSATPAPVLAVAAPAVGSLGLAAATVTMTMRGSGFRAAMAAVQALRESLGQAPTLCVHLAVRGTVGDLVTEVVCGLYRAAAEGGIPVVHPVFTVAEADGDEESVALTVIAWAPGAAAPGASFDAQWHPHTEAAAADAPTFIVPTLRRSMEGSLSALRRALCHRMTVKYTIQPMAIEQVEVPVEGAPDGATERCEAIHAQSVEKLVRQLTPQVIPVFAMDTSDAALILGNEALRAAIDQHLQNGGRMLVLGGACCVFSAYGYLPEGLSELACRPLCGKVQVTYPGMVGAQETVRIVRRMLLVPEAVTSSSLLCITLPDGTKIPDGFVGRDGAVLGLCNGVDSTVEALLQCPRFLIDTSEI